MQLEEISYWAAVTMINCSMYMCIAFFKFSSCLVICFFFYCSHLAMLFVYQPRLAMFLLCRSFYCVWTQVD